MWVKMEQILKLSEIIPYENNARKNDKAVKDVAAAERAAAEKWQLSDREREIIKKLK